MIGPIAPRVLHSPPELGYAVLVITVGVLFYNWIMEDEEERFEPPPTNNPRVVSYPRYDYSGRSVHEMRYLHVEVDLHRDSLGLGRTRRHENSLELVIELTDEDDSDGKARAMIGEEITDLLRRSPVRGIPKDAAQAEA